MPQYNVVYRELRLTRKELNKLFGERFQNNSDYEPQRALIVIRTLDGSEINEAYSVVGYIANIDVESRENIKFKREPKQWTKKEVTEKLRRDSFLEFILDLDKNGNVPNVNPKCTTPYMKLMNPTRGNVPLELYLVEHSTHAFLNLGVYLETLQVKAFDRARRLCEDP